jgi:protein with PEP-CTERM/exosortase system signal/uncharacterized protein DUF642
MKALPKILLALTAVAALSFAHAASANLITNGDFETGDFTGWTVTEAPSGSIIYVAQEPEGPGPDTTFGAVFASIADLDSISQTFATTPGAFYTLTFFYHTAVAGNNEFRVLFGGAIIFDNLNANPGFDTFTFNVRATSALTTLEFDGRNRPSFDFLDNVSVTAGVSDGGSTVSMLGCAFLGLVPLRRKLGC